MLIIVDLFSKVYRGGSLQDASTKYSPHELLRLLMDVITETMLKRSQEDHPDYEADSPIDK